MKFTKFSRPERKVVYFCFSFFYSGSFLFLQKLKHKTMWRPFISTLYRQRYDGRALKKRRKTVKWYREKRIMKICFLQLVLVTNYGTSFGQLISYINHKTLKAHISLMKRRMIESSLFWDQILVHQFQVNVVEPGDKRNLWNLLEKKISGTSQ